MQNIKMLLFFHVKTPCFEVFLSYEFYLACFSVLSSSTHSVAVSSILSVWLCVCIYTHTHKTVHSQQVSYNLSNMRRLQKSTESRNTDLYTCVEMVMNVNKVGNLLSYHSITIWNFKYHFSCLIQTRSCFPLTEALVSIPRFWSFPEYSWYFNYKDILWAIKPAAHLFIKR